MFRRIASLFGRKPALVKGAGKLQEGTAKKVDFGDPIAGSGVSVVLCRVEGVMHAVDARCPHEGGRINEGPLAEGKYLVCPLHMYMFEPDTGEAINAACRKATVYKCRETPEGDAEVWL